MFFCWRANAFYLFLACRLVSRALLDGLKVGGTNCEPILLSSSDEDDDDDDEEEESETEEFPVKVSVLRLADWF